MILFSPLNKEIYKKFIKIERLIYSTSISPEEREVLRYQYRIFLNSKINNLNRRNPKYKTYQHFLSELQDEHYQMDQSIDDLLGLFPNSEKVHNALAVATLSHMDQQYLAGTLVCPYQFHPVQVALILVNEIGIYDEKIISAALLHDVLEKSDRYDLYDIKDRFGTQIAAAVDVLTIWNPGRFTEKIKSIRDDREFAVFISLADRLHHLRNIRYAYRYHEDFINRTREIYIPVMGDTDNATEIYLIRHIKKAVKFISCEDSFKEESRTKFLSLTESGKWIQAMELMKDCGEFIPFYRDISTGRIDYVLRRDRHFVYLISIAPNGKEGRLFRGN